MLIGPCRTDKIELEKGLGRWAWRSYWLDDTTLPEKEGQLPADWRLGNRPNLTQMQAAAAALINDDVVKARMIEEIQKAKTLTSGASALGVRVHTLPTKPKDIEDDQVKLLKWQDEALEGKGFINWTPFDHPQLGKVEIGGWVPKTVRQNAPPGKMLEEECAKNCTFTMKHALTTPLLRVSEAKAERVGDGVYRVTAIVGNLGYLATNLTAQAKKAGVAKPVEVCISLPAGATVIRDVPRKSAVPKLSDLRESGAIEQDADVVMLLRRPHLYKNDPQHDDQRLAIVDVAKHRNGPTGEVELNFEGSYTRFENRLPADDRGDGA